MGTDGAVNFDILRETEKKIKKINESADESDFSEVTEWMVWEQ